MVAVLGATGCSGDDSDLPQFGGASPGGATASVAPGDGSSGPAVEEIVDVPKRGTKIGDEENAITIGRMAKADTDTEAVQVAYLRFWVTRATALRLAKVDQAVLDKVATGEAADGVVDSVNDLAAEKHHAEGGSTVNVRSTKITGGTAKLTDCFQDLSVTTNADGEPVEAPDLAPIPFEVTLVKAADAGWRVSELVRGDKKSCA